MSPSKVSNRRQPPRAIPRARRVYERHGFVAVAMTDGDNEEEAPDFRYHWPGPEVKW